MEHTKETTIKTYKGFDKDLRCRGFQYDVGKEYELPEGQNVGVCKNGFHGCESPLEVLDYYPMFDNDGNENRFCEVEQSGQIDREEKTTKVCSSRIRIKAEIGLAGLIKAGIEWIKEVTNVGKVDASGGLNDNGGNSAQIGSSGIYAKIGSSGIEAKIGSCGSYAKIVSSGSYAQIGSSGSYAQIGSSGDYAKINSTGEYSVICCAGHNSVVKAKKGSWITLAEWGPKCVKTEYVDGERIKADTWYKLVDGEFREV